jgi:hypothetical protein
LARSATPFFVRFGGGVDGGVYIFVTSDMDAFDD